MHQEGGVNTHHYNQHMTFEYLDSLFDNICSFVSCLH